MRKSHLKLAAAGAMGVATMLLGPIGALAGITYDLSITKTHTGNFTAGQNGTFTITVSNSPNLSSTSGETVTVVDTLPTGLTFVSNTAGTGAWACNANGQTVTCTSTTAITQDNSTDFTLTVAVASNAPSSVVNSATVSALGDNTPNNDTATDTVTITGQTSPTPTATATPTAIPTQSAAPAATAAPILPRAGGHGLPDGVSYFAVIALGLLAVGGVAAGARQLRR